MAKQLISAIVNHNWMNRQACEGAQRVLSYMDMILKRFALFLAEKVKLLLSCSELQVLSRVPVPYSQITRP